MDITTSKTGSSRKEFNRMLEDCQSRKLDIVITKNISRFGRDTVETLDVAVRNIIEQLRQFHRPAKPERPHRVLPSQFRAGADHPKALQNALHLRFFYRGGISVPNLPSKGIFQLLQAFLVVRIHRHWLFQHII